MKWQDLWAKFDRDSVSLKTFPVCFQAMADGILPESLERWENSGRVTLRGGLWTRNGSDWPSGASVCSLSQILQENVAKKYFLSPKACAGILRRAEKRGKELPEPLARALKAVADSEPTSTSGGGLSKALKAQPNLKHREDSETYVLAHGQANAEAVRDGSPCLTCNHEAPIVARALSAGRDGPLASGDHPSAIAYRTSGNCGPFEQGDKTGALNTATDPNQNIIVAPTLDARSGRSGESSFATSGGLIPIQSVNMVREKKQNGIGIGAEGDEMFTLTGRDQHAVAFTERTRKDGRNLETQDDVAYALTNPGGGGRAHSRSIQHDQAVRRLTPTECERLQGFPDGWTGGFSDSTRYRMLGNAVAVPVAEWIAKRLMRVIK